MHQAVIGNKTTSIDYAIGVFNHLLQNPRRLTVESGFVMNFKKADGMNTLRISTFINVVSFGTCDTTYVYNSSGSQYNYNTSYLKVCVIK